MNPEKIIESARKTLKIESDAIANLVDHVNDDFVQSIEHILESKGRLVVTGIGKSANIANKIVATFNSTGTPALFMHAADAIHGDLGLIQKDDVVMCLSKSGNTQEIKVLIPLIKTAGNKIIGMTSHKDSYLGQQADFVVHVPVEQEACPNNLAPTTSTTAQLAMGDAMAVALIECRGFSSNDFAKYHPGGSLGKKLYLRIGELVEEQDKPQVSPEDSIPSVIMEMTGKRLGATAVVQNGDVIGMITDGDLRRMLQKHEQLDKIQASEVMNDTPKCIEAEELAIDAFNLMESNNITQIIVLNQGQYLGIVHIHDLLREGIY